MLYNWYDYNGEEKEKRAGRVFYLVFILFLMGVSWLFVGCSTNEVKTLKAYELESLCVNGVKEIEKGVMGDKRYPNYHKYSKCEDTK